ncbi:glutathione S-transferase family protein [Siculibacillus lacustris]|uniref:Glutathione S-transferase family protein n=1 Tax=Siculibacillus lacustris TaxID=1549641 RepID=A0A4Q9VEZ6_9HYPH|nr:glutathione S-transferase [Siculibacillus lacustris]TBW33420.1 glutathione S-transferase family protein [Siculibacillus lacustris]
MITLCGFGVSNYYNKLKIVLLEKNIAFDEKTIYPWERDAFRDSSPLGRIPYVETEHGSLSESQVILDYLEDAHPETPLYPAGAFARAKCRELIQHLELNVEWVNRRLYKQAFFGGEVSEEIRREVRDKLAAGLEAVGRLASFSPFVFGATFTAADCVAYVHLDYVRSATLEVYGEDLLARHLPAAAAYLAFVAERPHVRRAVAERATALATFRALGVAYDG